jgi:hypothetical protein
MPACPSTCHCPRCDATLGAVMRMSTADYATWLKQTASRHSASDSRTDYLRQPPPSGYPAPKPVPVRPSTEATRTKYLRQPPPNGYAIALEKKRKANG